MKPTTTPPRAAGMDQAALVPLVERLEALSFTFEALNASSRTYAAEAVLETLGRMERRDLQALAAIEAFASALKTVSQHLAGLRNAIQTTAHDTATGFHLISERLDRLEGAPALPGPAGPHGNQLTLISDRLGHIEEMIGQGDSFDVSPIARLLDAVAHKVEQVEDKVDALPERVSAAVDAAVDMAPVTSNLETIAERVANVERKIDEAKQVDVAPLRDALETIGQRVARIEQRMGQAPAGMSLPEPFDPAPITEVLSAISNRISTMEDKVGNGPDVGALTSFLGMVSQRLERMEAGLGIPAESDEETAPVEPTPPSPPPSPKMEAPAEPVPPVIPAQPSTVAPTPPAAAKQQVDNLLEQVLKVLSR